MLVPSRCAFHDGFHQFGNLAQGIDAVAEPVRQITGAPRLLTGGAAFRRQPDLPNRTSALRALLSGALKEAGIDVAGKEKPAL